MSKKKDFRSMGPEDRDKHLADLRMELIKANSQVASGSAPENPGKIRAIKKNIARILTLKHEGGAKN